MHKEDLWFASQCGWGCLEGEKQMSPGPAAFSRSQLAHPRRGPQLGRRKRSAIPTPQQQQQQQHSPLQASLEPQPRLLPPRPPGGGPGSRG